MSVEIEIANSGKLLEIVELNTGIFDGLYETPHYSLQHYRERLEDVDPLIQIARDSERIVGDSIAFQRGNSWHVWILGVDKQFREKGIATKFFDLNEAHAREIGLETVTAKVYNVSAPMQCLLIQRDYLITEVELSQTHPKFNAVYFQLNLK